MADWRWAFGDVGFGDMAGDVRGRARALRRRLKGQQPEPDPRIVAYHGYGVPEQLTLRGRVLEHSVLPDPSPGDPWWRNLVGAYRRLESDEIPHARILARYRGREVETRADEEGFFRVDVQPAAPPEPDRLWHRVDLELLAPESERPPVPGEVLVPPSSARFGVISDIDDTIVRTNVADTLTMVREVLFGNVHTRVPFEGVASFYRALQRGTGQVQQNNPIFYVSSSPWNLYDVLFEFLGIHGIPRGPIELRDWGVRLSALPFGHRSHKLAAIRRILATYPALPFVLVGDSGQDDPEIYRDVVREFPERVLAVYVRDVSGTAERRGSIRSLAMQVAKAGSTLLLAESTAVAARHAAERGWIADADVGEVAAEAAEDRAAGSGGAFSHEEGGPA